MGRETRHFGFLHHYIFAGELGFDMILQLADQIALASVRLTALANVLNDGGQAFLVSAQKIVAKIKSSPPNDIVTISE